MLSDRELGHLGDLLKISRSFIVVLLYFSCKIAYNTENAWEYWRYLQILVKFLQVRRGEARRRGKGHSVVLLLFESSFKGTPMFSEWMEWINSQWTRFLSMSWRENVCRRFLHSTKILKFTKNCFSMPLIVSKIK